MNAKMRDKKIKTAITKGQLQDALELLDGETELDDIHVGLNCSASCKAALVRKVVLRAAAVDFQKLAKELLSRILAIETMLMHRVEMHVIAEIQRFDSRAGSLSPRDLPENLADIHLPRLDRLQGAVRETLKAITNLEKDHAARP